jgi:hypothetical protein
MECVHAVANGFCFSNAEDMEKIVKIKIYTPPYK